MPPRPLAGAARTRRSSRMSPFAGFPSGKVHLTPIPAPFFSDLLPEIDHLGELKITLYALWFLDQQEGNLRYLALKDLLADRRLLEGLSSTPGISSFEESESVRSALLDAIDRATRRGTLLRA